MTTQLPESAAAAASARPLAGFYAATLATAAPEEIPVESSVLESVRYDARLRILELTFDGGRVYHYLDVPEPVKDGLLSAPSKGRYFQERIRGQYEYRRIY